MSFCWQEGFSPALSSFHWESFCIGKSKAQAFDFGWADSCVVLVHFLMALPGVPSPASYRPAPPPRSLQPAPHGEAFTVTPAQREHRLPFASLVCNKCDLVLSSSLTLKQHRGWRMPDPLSSTSRAMGLFIKTSSLFLLGFQWSCPGESFVHSLGKKPTVWS